MTSYPHSVIIQFRNSGDLGTGQELSWRQDLEAQLGKLFRPRISYVDGGQGGAGTMEIFIRTNDLPGTFDEIIKYLTDQEYIGFAKVVGSLNVMESGQIDMIYPPGATFSLGSFD